MSLAALQGGVALWEAIVQCTIDVHCGPVALPQLIALQR